MRDRIPSILRLLNIAWRNLFRNKRRNLLTLAILMMGSGGLLLVGGYFHSLMEGFRELYIHSQTGHFQLSLKGYREKGASDPFAYLLPQAQQTEAFLESFPHVKDAFLRLQFGGMLSNEQTQMGVMVFATDAISEGKMGKVRSTNSIYEATTITEGKDLDPSDPYGVVLGKGLMEALSLKVGDPIGFITHRPNGALEGADFHVRGIFTTVLKDFDERLMKINLEMGRKILGLGDQAHVLVTVLDHTSNVESTLAIVRAMVERKKLPLEAVSWEENALYYHQGKDMLDRILSVVQVIVALVFAFSIANILNMALMERSREFGTMMAIGNTRSTIFSVILVEAAFLGLIGSLLGLGFGFGMGKLINSLGIEMPPGPQITESYLMEILLYPRLIVQTTLLTLGATILGALLPAYRVSHFPITRALGYV